MLKELENTFNKIDALYAEFKDAHIENVSKTNKSAGARARKSLNELRKFVTEYRKNSTEFCKTTKKEKKA